MRKILRILLGIFFIVIGTAVYLYPDYREWELQKSIPKTASHPQIVREKETEKRYTEMESELQTEGMDEMFLSREKSAELLEEMQKYNRNLAVGEQEILDAWDFRKTPVDLSGLSSEIKAIGSIELPDIDLTLPLFIGASEANMSKGAVVLAGTSMPIGGSSTNCVIAAHRGWSGSPYFRDIDQLKVGSLVKISNPWDVLLYQVTGTEIIHATENEILNIQPGKDMVTLFSCYPYGQVGTRYRQVIFCERISGENKQQKEGTAIREITEQIVQEKGIVIEEDLSRTLSEHEDQVRWVLPLILAGLVLLWQILHRFKRH